MHLDISFGLQLVESSSLDSVLFREAFSHPYISFFNLLVNGFSVTCIYIFIIPVGLSVLLISCSNIFITPCAQKAGIM